MKYIIYGGAGFLGQAIAKRLVFENHEVIIADLRKPDNLIGKFVEVNLLKNIVLSDDLKGPDVVINLAGKRIFGRWNEDFKRLIHDTRVLGTRNIISTFIEKEYRPTYLVQASAVGIYGSHDDQKIDEDSSYGDSFLSKVAIAWEDEAMKAKQLGVMVRILRNGNILGNDGLLKVMLPVYRWGVGGPLGNGEQWMPWIHIDDVVELYLQAVSRNWEEVVNAVSPQPIKNKDFSRKLAEALHRPHLFFVPKFVLKIMYGEFAKEILVSQKVKSKYVNAGYFSFPGMTEALDDILKKEK